MPIKIQAGLELGLEQWYQLLNSLNVPAGKAIQADKVNLYFSKFILNSLSNYCTDQLANQSKPSVSFANPDISAVERFFYTFEI